MFGLGIWEIGFIFLVIILLFGAKSLPDIAKGLAKAFYAFKNELADTSAEFKNEKPFSKPDHSAEENTNDQKNHNNS